MNDNSFNLCALTARLLCTNAQSMAGLLLLAAVVSATSDSAFAGPLAENDDCANALSVGNITDLPFDTTNATHDGPIPSCGDSAVRDIWYCYTATCDGVAIADTIGSSFDSVLAVYEGCDNTFTEIGCNADSHGTYQSTVAFDVVSGNQYKIQVTGFESVFNPSGNYGTGDLTISCTVPLENDECDDAQQVAIPDTVLGTTIGALNDPDALDCPSVSIEAPGVWFTVEGTGTTITASLCGDTNYDSRINVYCGSCDDFTCVSANDDGDDCSSAESETSWCSKPGVIYYIFVQGFRQEVGDFGLEVTADDVACDPDVFCPMDERAHPGWNHVSTEITLTKNEPTYWSAYSGQPKGVAPLTVLDPGDPPGRPANDGTNDRVLRGYVVAWAVNSNNEEIRWNHLKGDAVLINYEDATAWEYNAWAFQSVGAAGHGEQTGDPGIINLDGNEFAQGFDQLIVDFYASGSHPFGAFEHEIDTDLTIHPISTDLRQEDDGPVTTKLKIDVWNENEVKFNGAERCVTCWDQTLLSNYAGLGIPNNFLYSTLQTNKGKARIDGIRSDNCDLDYEFDPDVPFGDDPRDIVSEDASILGLAAKWVTADDGQVRAGMNVHGSGTETAVIRYDVLEQTPESTGGSNLRRSRGHSVAGLAGNGTLHGAVLEGAPAGQDRVSGSEKGSVLIFSKVEVRWTFSGELIQDTFVDITNDFGEDVTVQMYFINGDAPANAVDMN